MSGDTVERQDVDISKLFNWGRAFDVVDGEGSVLYTVYLKLLGDADLGRARVHALRKSADMRRQLRDEDSDLRVAWVRPFGDLEAGDIINLIILYSSREITNNAKAKVKIQTPKPPKSNAKLEKLEKFQKEVDEYPAKRVKAMADAIEKEVEALKNSLSPKSKEDLYKEYVRLLVDEFCEREAVMAFEDMQTYLGCYKDDSYKAEARFFSNFEEFDNLEPSIKVQFKDAYRSIDIDLSELKKLRRATP